MAAMPVLLALAFLADTPRVEPIEPPPAEAVDSAIARGVDFLVEDQNPDGSWGGFVNTAGPVMYDPLPGSHHAFRSATTALCVLALIELDGDRPLDAKAADALDKAGAWLVDDLPGVRRTTPDVLYNVWSHAYAVQAMAAMLPRAETDARRAEIRAAMEGQLAQLDRFESVDGGWGYYDFRVQAARPSAESTSFCNAAVLVAMKAADDAGVEVNKRTLERALLATRLQRKPDFSYLYAIGHRTRPMGGINRPGGSLGRSQACNIALRLWGDEAVTDEVLATWLHRLFARGGWLDIGRKRPIPHESWMGVAGYFYYFGHYYAALCIDQLPAEDRPLFQHHMAATMLDRQEADGSWWDYPMYDFHQPYGTAFALLTLRRCR